MFDSYEVGARCWVPSKTAGWVSATVETKRVSGDGASCELDLRVDADGAESDEKKTVTIKSEPSPDVPLRNPPALEATSDLVTLSYLNEPSVLHAIRQRYAQLNIYTFSGIVLIATNPFDRVDNLYTKEVVQMYSGRQRGELEPHLFSIAEDAFRCMQRDNKNQTIVVSGESGAGKTMSAKYIMRYFATVEDPQRRKNAFSAGAPISGASQLQASMADLDLAEQEEDSYEGLSRVEREILATNPIMEAFGNAKTTRNDNSSRFGKYLEIRFNDSLDISGARIRTYLLERSRIVYHPQTERNYHIFYQLLRGLPEDKLAQLGLDQGLESFNYVSQGDPNIAGVDDASDFKDTCEALNIVGVDEARQWRVFELLAALLHLGNIQLKSTSRAVLVSSEDPALLKCAELLGISADLLAKWLMKKQIQMRSEAIISDLDAKTAFVVRDSIAKYLYSALFDWLVAAVNSKLYTGDGGDRFIGVLDIYGFEHFKHNSFEQFCINYANEKLQQEFNQHVFKLEQEEYAAEEIDWQYIDFVDNQPCITLIEAKMGILGLLDEESRLPAGTDEGLIQKLYGSLDGKPNFKKPRLGQTSFIVAHYAHDVEYETEGFIEKNRDTVPDTIINVLNDTKNPFLSEVLELPAKADAAIAAAPAPAAPAKASLSSGRGVTSKRPTLGNIFKTSLIELMNTISSTNAHYIRCIKPNEDKEAWQFDGPMVLSQLRACGVLETIRISSKGFPGRWFYEEFASRYDLLLHSSEREKYGKDARRLSLAVLEAFQDGSDEKGKNGEGSVATFAKTSYALGKSKVFLRAGMLARLENRRTKRQQDSAISIQRLVKMHSARSSYLRTTAFIQQLQVAARAKVARERLAKARAERALVQLQAVIRSRAQQQKLQTALSTVKGIQNAIRALQARTRTVEANKHNAATSIQTLVRAHLGRKAFTNNLRVLTLVQSMVRRRGARSELKRLKEDQHSFRHYEENQLLMENKVVELQNALSTKREDHKGLIAQLETVQLARDGFEQQLTELQSTHSTAMQSHEEKKRGLTEQINKHAAEVEDLRSELDSRNKQVEQLRDTLAEQEQLVQSLTVEVTELRKHNQDLEDQVHLAQMGQIGTASLVSYQNRQQHTADLANNQTYGSPTSDAQQFYEQQQHAAADSGSRTINLDEMSEEQYRINELIEQILQQDANDIREELISKLIKNVELPSTKLNEPLPEREVLFPANITNLLVSELWRFGLIQQSESLISAVLVAINDTVSRCSSEQIVNAGPFWLTNVHEMYSFMTLAETNIIHSTQLHSQMAPEELKQYAALTQLAKQDLTSVIFNIYYLYMKGLKKLLDRIVVQAIIEDQTIPGFKIETHSNRFLPSLFSTSTPARMDDLIMLLSNILSALKAYHLEDYYIRQPLFEVIRFIGTKSFNDMIMRRNFLTWRRGVQINYNITRIVEWCKSHNLGEIIGHLEHITQATKLLQLKKNWDENESVEVIYDICWSLNPTQIQRFVSNYHTTDYEPPISSKAHQIITNRVKESKGKPSELLLSVRGIQDSGPFEICEARALEKLEPYIPQRLQVPKLREITDLTTTSSRLQDAQIEQEQLEQRELAQRKLEQQEEEEHMDAQVESGQEQHPEQSQNNVNGSL